MAGELTLQLDGDRRTLEAGDSVRFAASEPHVYRNEGEVEARGFWLVASAPTAPGPALQPMRAGDRNNKASSAAASAAADAPAAVGDAQAITPSGRTSTAPSEPSP